GIGWRIVAPAGVNCEPPREPARGLFLTGMKPHDHTRLARIGVAFPVGSPSVPLPTAGQHEVARQLEVDPHVDQVRAVVARDPAAFQRTDVSRPGHPADPIRTAQPSLRSISEYHETDLA